MGVPVKLAAVLACMLLLSGCQIEIVTLGEGQVSVVSANATPCSGTPQCLEGGYNRLIELEAEPAAGSVFAGWSGACEDLGTCRVRTLGAKTVVAVFRSTTEGMITPLMDYTPAFFFSGPWPSDLKTKADGQLDLSGFPFTGSLFENAIRRDSQPLTGFARHDAIYLPFDGRPYDFWNNDQGRFPQVWHAFRRVNLSSGSPSHLQTIPVTGQWHRNDDFRKDNLLRVEPMEGFVLDPGTTYGLIVLETEYGPQYNSVRRGPAMAAIAAGQGSAALQAHWLRIRDYVENHMQDFTAEQVAAFTIFTTRQPSDKPKLVREFLARQDTLADSKRLESFRQLSDDCEQMNQDPARAALYELELRLPFFLQGKPPFLFSGGGLNLDANGNLQESTPDTLARAIVSVPCGTAVPEDGYPINIFALGTGDLLDDHVSHDAINQRNHRAVTVYLAAPYTSVRTYAAGLTDLGWLEQLLGIETELLYVGLGDFNPLNWNAIEPQYLQYGADMVHTYAVSRQLSELLAASGNWGELPRQLRIDPQQVTFSGVSLGALAAINADTLFQHTHNVTAIRMPRPNIQHMNNIVEGLVEDYITDEALAAMEWVLGIDFPMDLTDPSLGVLQRIIDPIDTANHLDQLANVNLLLAMAPYSDALHGGKPSYEFAQIIDRRFGLNPVLREDDLSGNSFPIGSYNESPAFQFGDSISTAPPVKLVLYEYYAVPTIEGFPWLTSQPEFVCTAGYGFWGMF